jgi:hypothetical protein
MKGSIGVPTTLKNNYYDQRIIKKSEKVRKNIAFICNICCPFCSGGFCEFNKSWISIYNATNCDVLSMILEEIYKK